MAIAGINRIDDFTLNITCPNSTQASAIEKELYDFARNDLMESLDKTLMSLAPEEDIILDNLTIDLGTVPAQNSLNHILQNLPNELERTLRVHLLERQCLPVGQILQESCERRLPLQKSAMLEKEINDEIFEWCREHSDEKFDPLRIAEAILKRIQSQAPGLDIRQIACSVFEKLKKLNEKKKPAPAARIPHAGDCGIVLLAPYIPMLLDKAGCTDNKTFKDDSSRALAVSLLNYTVYGSYTIPPTEISIAQVLCGLDPAIGPVEECELSDEQKTLANSLLAGVIANWNAIGHSTPDGLRASFLIRQGTLNDSEEGPLLAVENSAYDILLDKLPWGYSTVKLPWMKSPLHVKWR